MSCSVASPSLIDFKTYHPRQTLLDRQDTYGYPAPVPATPYKDDFSDSSSEDARSEGEKEVEKLLAVVPRNKRRTVRRLASATNSTLTKEDGGDGADGCFSITLPDGSNISFRPPVSGSSALISGPSAGPVSLSKPVIAQGFEEAFEAIKRLAIGNGSTTAPPKPLPAPAKKAVEGSKKRNIPLHPSNHSLPQLKASGSNKVSQGARGPWPILSSLPTVQPSKLVPTAPVFRPARLTRPKGYKPQFLIPPSPSTSPSPPLSYYTDNPPFIDSSRTTSPERSPPFTICDSPSGVIVDGPIHLTSPGTLQSLFTTDIKAIPWTTVDFPYTNRPKKKRTKGSAGEESVHVAQTAAEINKKFDDILKSFEPPKPTPPVLPIRKDIDKELKKALSKVRATREPLANQRLNPVASAWAPSATTVRPRAKRAISTKLVDVDSAPLPAKVSYDYSPEAGITIYDPPSPPPSIPHIHTGNMNGVSIDDWKTEEVQDVNAYFEERDRLEKLKLRVLADPIHTAKLVDVSEFAQTINKARLKALPAALPFTPYDRLLSLPSARASVPRHLCTTSDELQTSLLRSWIAAEPTDDQKRYVKELAELLTRMVDQKWGRGAGARDQRFTVDVFGSVSWGGETGRGGDVDMVIRDSFYPQGYHPALWTTEEEDPVPRWNRNKPRVNVLRADLSPVYDLHNVVYLLKEKGYDQVFGIYGASTPIAKFKDPLRPGVEADINVNDLGGWYNSRLILAYCEISPHVLRPLIHCLKLWAKVNHINDPSGKHGMPTMSSYCLTLMAIGYLQHCGILPNLQADVEVRIPDFPETEGKDVIWAGWGKSTGTKINVGFAEQPKAEWKSLNPGMTVADAVRGFFSHFARTGSGRAFQYNTQVVSILNGGMLDRAKTQGQETQEAQARKAAGLAPLTKEEMVARESMMGKGDQGVQPRNWGERKLVVQDPFIWQKNCTQSMSKQGLDRWMLAVDKAHQTLSLNRDRCTLDTLLANCLPAPTSLPPRHYSNHGADNQSRVSRDQMYRSNGGGGGGMGQLGTFGQPRWAGSLPPRPSSFGRTLFSPR